MHVRFELLTSPASSRVSVDPKAIVCSSQPSLLQDKQMINIIIISHLYIAVWRMKKNISSRSAVFKSLDNVNWKQSEQSYFLKRGGFLFSRKSDDSVSGKEIIFVLFRFDCS
jgi:hypothetical protein